MAITLSIPHQLGRAEARRRIEAGFAKMIHYLPGSAGTCTERWDGDRLIFAVAAVGQTITGVVNVFDGAVTMEIELPGVLGMDWEPLQGSAGEGGPTAVEEMMDNRSPLVLGSSCPPSVRPRIGLVQFWQERLLT